MSVITQIEAALASIKSLDDEEILNAERLADLYSDIKPVPYSIRRNGIFSRPQNQNQTLFVHRSNR